MVVHLTSFLHLAFVRPAIQHDGMIGLRIVCVLMASAGIGYAAITAAWKMPVEGITPDWRLNGEPPPLETHPGDSAFFRPGDKLLDLSRCVKWQVREVAAGSDSPDEPFAADEPEEVDIQWLGDWIVWNSRSEMIVARGSWHDIFTAQDAIGFDELPLVIRTRVEITGKPGIRPVSLVSRSGEKAKLEGSGLRVEVEPVFSSRWGSSADSPFRVAWPAVGMDAEWIVTTAATLREGARVRLACHGAADAGWELFASVERELTDGTPWKEARWLETHDGPAPWPASHGHGEAERKQLGPDRWLGIYHAGPADLAMLRSRSGEKRIDAISPPEGISEWVRSPLVDARELLATQGVKVKGEGSFAGIDPLSHRAFIVTDEMNQDLAEQVFFHCLHCVDATLVWVEANPESGGWGLVSRSGETAQIQRSGKDKTTNLLFRSEPIVGGNGRIIDFGYAFDVVAGDSKIGELKTRTTLTKDRPQVIGSLSGPDGKEVKVVVTASDG
jgi:hypothetical protein